MATKKSPTKKPSTPAKPKREDMPHKGKDKGKKC